MACAWAGDAHAATIAAMSSIALKQRFILLLLLQDPECAERDEGPPELSGFGEC
jgi:hypothetical protein